VNVSVRATRLAVALAALTFVAGCGDNGAPAAEVPRPTPTAENASLADAPTNVATKPVAMDAAALAAAAWTRNACSLNGVNATLSEFQADRAQPVVFRGYLIDETGGVPANFSLVLKQGTSLFTVPATTGVARPDVAEFFRNPALERAGFEVAVDASDLDAGAYEVKFLIDRGEQSYFCEADAGVALR
jgi:hypothetical protein